MSKLLTIGVLDTSVTTPDYLRRFYSWGYPEKITPGKRTAKYDIVIIPDKISTYVGLPCFAGGYEPIGLPPMDNMAELFRIHERGLNFYAANSLMIGVGDGAIMLWNYLQHKAVIVGEKAEIKLVRDKAVLDTVWKGDDLFVEEWQTKNFVGIKDLWSPTLTNILKEEHSKITEIIQEVENNSKPALFRLTSKK